MSNVLLRLHTDNDAPKSLDVFIRAVRETASNDYTAEQISAWANSDDRDRVAWTRSRAAANTQVAEIDGHLAGFIDVAADGYIDMLFVDPSRVRTGIASALLAWAETTARASGAVQLSTHASITARPFFAAHGFVVVEERKPVLRGIALTNYLMTAALR